jgi:hypothetical protein
MTTWLLKEPWGLLSKKSKSYKKDLRNLRSPFPFDAPIQLLIPSDAKYVEYGSRRYGISPLSPSFTWENQKLKHYSVPYIWKLNKSSIDDIKKEKLTIRWVTDEKKELILKPETNAAEYTDKQTEHQIACKTIEWQLSYFRELLNITGNKKSSDLDASFKGGARLSWTSISNIWFTNLDFLSNPRTTLIARVAQDDKLLEIFKEISSSPNQTLKKSRQKQEICKVQEIDTTCIRWLARRSGKSYLEKSMPSQKILAVVSNSNYETLENKIFAYVILRLKEYAVEYIRTNSSITFSEKKKCIGDLHKLLISIMKNPWIPNASIPQPPVIPNYTLLNCPKYKYIWNLYIQLLKIDQEFDDAWKYQRSIWIDTGKQLIGGALEKLSKDYEPLKPICSSTAYLNNEQHDGHWLRQPCTPGPYELNGHELHHIDAKEVEDHSELAQLMGPFGAHQMLLYRTSPKKQNHLLIWYVWSPYKDDYTNSCSLALQKFKKNLSPEVSNTKEYKGLIILGPCQEGEPELKQSPWGSVVQIKLGLSAQRNYEFISQTLSDQFEAWIKNKN